MAAAIPVVLFAYKRVDHLRRVLECLRREAVPELIVFVDGPRTEADRPAVVAVRELVRAIDWTRCTVHAAETNRGLGRSIVAGVTRVAAEHDAFLVFEDDLICAPGTYAWLCAALAAYRDEPGVFSVTGWTHPDVVPPGNPGEPYLDGRAECWVWGAWARSWRGMDEGTALTRLAAAEKRGVPRGAYGSDLPVMAADEERRNIWAVRWLYHHLVSGGLCVRPPFSMVEHIGFDDTATNAGAGEVLWRESLPAAAPAVPLHWPAPVEAPGCAARWRRIYPSRTFVARLWRALRRRLGLRA